MITPKTVQSGKINFLDYTDLRKVEVSTSVNVPTIQIWNSNTNTHTPDWTSTNVELIASVFLDSQPITFNTGTTITWWTKSSSGEEVQITNSSGRVISGERNEKLTIKTNELSTSGIMTYVCKAEYQKITGRSETTFARTDTGLNGVDGADGTSITILGTFESLEALKTTHPTGNPGDSYIIDGRLWVWAIDDQAWEDVGNIQGAPGKDGQDAKAIFLNANTQVFKVNKFGVISPTTIKVTAQSVNTKIDSYSYSIDGGQTFVSAADGVSRNGNQIIINGSDMTSDSITIMASGEQYQDIFTVYKVSDGETGNDGKPAPITFLTNENIGFIANSKGQVSATSAVTNIVAFIGTTPVKPTIGSLSSVPEGMTITQAEVGNEILLTLTIANNATLGSAKSNGGRIKIPVTIPTVPVIQTDLWLGWNKVNTGRSVSSIAARYAVSNNNVTAPTSWSIIIPIREAGQYLWMADYVTYDDGTTATIGPRVVTGDTGTPGISIDSVASYFANNQDRTSAPGITATWTTTPNREIGYYTWRKDLIIYSDSTTEYTTPVCITGDQGDDGATYYTWIKYADDANGTNMSDDPLNKLYIGLAYNKLSPTESTVASDYQWSLFKGADGVPGDDAVTFQVYSTDGYILSNSTPRVTLQTFAYIGDTQITGDVTYQWYQIKDGITTAITGANGSSYDVYHSDVLFTNTYMCTMTFRGLDYSGVVTIDDKNDINTVFSSKPTSYSAGDIWVVGADYIPSGAEIGTVLKAEHTNNTYADSDWVTATKYDEHIKALEDNITQYNQYFSFDSQEGLRISARDSNGNASQFSTTLSNDRLSFNQGNEAVAYIESNKLKIKEAEIISPLTVTGVYSGSTMQQAPIINIGNFSIIVENNGSLSIVANT